MRGLKARVREAVAPAIPSGLRRGIGERRVGVAMAAHVFRVAGVCVAERAAAEEFGNDALLIVGEVAGLAHHRAGGERGVDRLGRHLAERFGAGGARGSTGVSVGAGHHILMATGAAAVEDGLGRDAGRRADHCGGGGALLRLLRATRCGEKHETGEQRARDAKEPDELAAGADCRGRLRREPRTIATLAKSSLFHLAPALERPIWKHAISAMQRRRWPSN